MSGVVVRMSSVILVCLLVVACDKCGEPLRFNTPWGTKVCNGSNPQG